MVIFLILFSKLFETQIIKGNYFRTLAEENRIRHIPIPAPRGKITARGGEILAGNVEVKRRIKFSEGGGFTITDDLTGATEEEMITDYRRFYALRDKFAHGSGYLGEVDADEIDKINPDCPEKGPRLSGMTIGKSGLEKKYECRLSGVAGEELIEVDTSGKKIRTLGTRSPIPGQDIKTTIDFGLQKEVATQMGGKKGAAVITDVNGEILAFYSGPSFDPGAISTDLFKNPDLPFFDRVISGTFHPGSVFKPIVAIAALSERAIDKNFTFDDPGVIKVNDFSYANWYFTEYGAHEGRIGLVRAIARSTDTFFYKIGEMVGPEGVAKWAGVFGLNQKTGIDLGGEVAGLIPTPEWKKKVKKEAWFLGNTYHMSIGQGDVAVTPLEINMYIAAIAKEGSLCKPHFSFGQESCRELDVEKEDLEQVVEGMKEACAAGGTGYTFFDFAASHGGRDVACKTGTAESSTDDQEPHAWFTLFAPAEKPEIVATILIEHGGQGSQVAGPIARRIMDYVYPR